jgi:hypothetical protein
MIGIKVNLVCEKRWLPAQLFLLLAALAAIPPAGASAASLCIQVQKNGLPWRTIPVSSGSEVRLSFQHSIYGSRVEELFHLAPDVFHLTELRYAERRLAEFYGYEDANHKNNMWVVPPRPAAISSLSLRTSAAASLSLFFDQEQNSLELAMPPDSALQLTIAACKDAQNG